MTDNPTVAESHWIVKALSVEYGYKIRDIFKNTKDIAKFYSRLPKNATCPAKLWQQIKAVIKEIKANKNELIAKGKLIMKREVEIKGLPWNRILRNIRSRFSLTQQELANHLNLKREAISRWERNVNKPSLKYGEKLLSFIKSRRLKIDKLSKKPKEKNKKHRKKSRTEYSYIVLGLMKKFGYTQKQLGNELDLAGTTISGYVTGHRTPSKVVINKIDSYLSLHGLNKTEVKRFGKKYLKETEITFPNLRDPKLSEFIGIVLGDGTVTKEGISIYGHLIRDYQFHHEWIKNLVKDLFNKRVYFSEATEGSDITTHFKSKEIMRFLFKHGLKPGKKIDLHIPNFISENHECMKAFIRGVFDTDGSITGSKVQFNGISDYAFAKELNSLLKRLGFKTCFGKARGYYWIELTNQYEVTRFFSEVGSSNPSKISDFLSKKSISLKIEKLPFYWNEEYVNHLKNKKVLSSLKKDLLMLKAYKLWRVIDWKNVFMKLRGRYEVNKLANKLDCSNSIVYQWIAGSRNPSVESVSKILKSGLLKKIAPGIVTSHLY